MQYDGFREFLVAKEVPEKQINHYLEFVPRFEDFCSTRAGLTAEGHINTADIIAFSNQMIDAGLNTWDNYIALARYAQYRQDARAYRAILELVDGSEIPKNLYTRVGTVLGDNLREQIFAGIDLPPMGTPQTKKPAFTRAVMESLTAKVDPITCKSLLIDSLRDLKDETHLEARRQYQACESLDEYLELRGQLFIAELENIQAEGGLYFTQPITDEVIAFVLAHPEVRQGVRQGSVLFEIKIPYMTSDYLAESDERLKRYHYCHCPWVRESLINNESQISPVFCNCSAGYMKKPWEVIFGEPLQAEMVETVLEGDPWCRVAIQLPQGV